MATPLIHGQAREDLAALLVQLETRSIDELEVLRQILVAIVEALLCAKES